MHIKTRGIVLREVNYKEADKILTVLTEEGKCTVKARGCRRKNSPLAAASQLLTYSEMTLFEYRDHLQMNEAASLEQFWNCKQDVELLALGSYFAEVAEAVAEEGRPDEGLLPLLLNSLYALSALKKPQRLVKAAYELRLLAIAGYAPALDGCWICGREEPQQARLALNDGVLRCAACRTGEESGIALPVSPATLKAMRYLVACSAKRLFSFSVDEETLKQLGEVCEAYLMAQLERGFRTLDFYKQLICPMGYDG